MKTLKLAALLFLSLTLSFCSKDDDKDDKDTGASLIGTWRLTKEITKEPGEPDDVYVVPNGCNEVVLEISKTSIKSIDDDNCDGTTDDTYTSNYTRSGNTITTADGSAKITKLTATQLIFEQKDGDFTDILEFIRL